MPVKNAKKKTPQHLTNQVRIIGGDWRGRKLSFPNIPGLRPTGDKIRETLFNWLAPYIHQSQVLDLFSGSGALGMEALSRGAKYCNFVELNSKAALSLKKNLEILQCSKAQIINLNAFDSLSMLPAGSIDILFLDPPFDAHLHNKILHEIYRSQILSESALIYIEAPTNDTLEIPASWSLLKEKTSGHVIFSLYEAPASH